MGGLASHHGHNSGEPPRTLRALVRGVCREVVGEADPTLTFVTDDSRRVIPGALFVVRRGPARDGASFIADAIARGAGAILVEGRTPPAGPPAGLPVCLADDAALALAVLAERFHANPSSTLALVGVTGTNGKTTTTTLARHLLETAGLRCGLISTCAIDAGAGRPLARATQTTPGAAELSERLAAMRDAGCLAAVVETSSHALEQKRVAGLRYRVGVFTNLTGDHLDYHRTMEAYASAKAALFEMLPADGAAIVNADDPWGARMVRDCAAPIIACTMRDEDEKAIAHRLGRPIVAVARGALRGYEPGGVRVALAGPFGVIDLVLPLVGAHNAMNALQAACAAAAVGASREAIERGLACAPAPPGRLEPVAREPGVPEPFTVLVDYAHTDDALERALLAVRPLVAPGATLRVVFGCGGDRDRTKRPRMGAVAARCADEVIVTSDNPRTEDPDAIVAQVLDGVRGPARSLAIVDRERAIRHAIAQAEPGDVVLIAGKGHEDYQILPDGRGGTVTRHFDDREVARLALVDRFAGASVIEDKHAPLAAHNGGSSVA